MRTLKRAEIEGECHHGQHAGCVDGLCRQKRAEGQEQHDGVLHRLVPYHREDVAADPAHRNTDRYGGGRGIHHLECRGRKRERRARQGGAARHLEGHQCRGVVDETFGERVGAVQWLDG